MIGQTILHYKILEKLGEGGMGVVYKAEDLKLRRVVALKFLPHHVSASPEEEARFLQEAQAAATLNHANVCTIFDIKEADGKQFIVMEWIEGITLRKKITSGPISFDDAITYALQIGDALQEAHGKGIVHRDVKAENIMLSAKNQIKVMDFGLAKLKGSLKLTKTSSTIGTLAYMAPEQIQGGDVDARSDIFSFGVVLFEMLTGHTPFRGEHDAAMMYSILNETPEEIGKSRPEAPPELQRIMGRALEKDPEDRYQSVADMASELRKLKKQSTRVTRPLERVAERPEPAMTPVGATSAPIATGQSGATRSQKRKGVIVAVVILLLVAGGFLAYKYFIGTTSTIDSLAVLPFENASSDASAEYLSDGMTEGIINSLTRIPSLRVIPRSTVFRFKGKDLDPQDIGEKLGVAAVLSGRVSQHGEELTIQMDLVDVRKQSQIWGEQYRRSVNDVIAIQTDIVGDVSRQLRIALSGETKQDLAKRATENSDAYKLYLQGRYFWQKRRAAEIRKAIDFYNQAIALDPNFALAYKGLAECYLLLEQYAGVPWKESAPLAESAVKKALELDKTLGEAHSAMGFIKMLEWNWNGAEQEFKTAIALSPKYATAYHWYAILLNRMGRDEESFNAIQKAYELDPLSPVILLNVALGYDHSRHDLKTAMEYLQKALELDAGFGPAYHQMGRILMHNKKFEEALPNLRKNIELSGRQSEDLSSLGYCLASMGKKEEAASLVRELEDLYSKKLCSAYNIARVHAGLLDREKVFEWLQRDFADHSGWLAWIKYDFEWDEYREDPRFKDILQKIGLGGSS